MFLWVLCFGVCSASRIELKLFWFNWQRRLGLEGSATSVPKISPKKMAHMALEKWRGRVNPAFDTGFGLGLECIRWTSLGHGGGTGRRPQACSSLWNDAVTISPGEKGNWSLQFSGERTQGAWEMIGLVSALFLTMDKYCDPIEIYDEELLELVPFCHQIHPFCAGTATLFAASSVVLSMILYCQISFVPDQFLGDWIVCSCKVRGSSRLMFQSSVWFLGAWI